MHKICVRRKDIFMKFAIYVPIFGPFGDARTLIDMARDAEQTGWDGFFIWDQITGFGADNVVDTEVALTAIAMSTTKMRLGVLITPLARRRPAKYAREMLSIDHISNGRLICGVGVGNSKEEFADLGDGEDAKTRAEMVEEALQVITGLWTQTPFNFEGKYYHVEDAKFLPKPIQQPRIPIWMGGTWPLKAPMRRAAQWDGVFPLWSEQTADHPMPPEEFVKLIDFIKSERKSDAPFDVAHGGHSPADPAQAAAMVRPYADVGVTWWMETIDPWTFGGDAPAETWPVEAMRERITQGPPKL
jgi:alkanesulfonate monooxygenase SsuD/methylene tetrahydromethanopterin reductase-like flavin-dependent oxidoreductase (luciferase family)